MLDYLLKTETSSNDTHPSLSDRLKALGVLPVIEEQIDNTAAKEYLPGHLHIIEQLLDKKGLEDANNWWEERQQYVQRARLQLIRLGEKSKTIGLNDNEASTYIQLLKEFPDFEDNVASLKGLEFDSKYAGV